MPLGTTTSVTVRHLVAWLEAAGENLDAWKAEAGLASEDISAPDLAVPLEAFDALWARAVAHEPAIGLQLIDRFPPGQMHLVSHLALRAATVGEALRAVERYIALTDPMDRITLTVDGDAASVCYENPALADVRRRNPGFVEHLLAMCHTLLSSAAARDVPCRAVSFAGPRLAPASAYAARFGVTPRFEAGSNTLVMDARVLDWPLTTRDDYLRRLLESLAAERLPPPTPETLTERLTTLLRQAWWEGRPMDLATAAAALGLTPARLRAGLAAEGSGFRVLHDTTRRDVAEAHLAGPMAIGEIAYLLGFSEPAAFQHAVRRWFGASAGEVRARSAQRRAR